MRLSPTLMLQFINFSGAMTCVDSEVRAARLLPHFPLLDAGGDTRRPIRGFFRGAFCDVTFVDLAESADSSPGRDGIVHRGPSAPLLAS
mmetsp:Transcript_6818/g.14699  ORF Transcript_6818/g.14699 Transcript_6818/m.14699 type:complete len:89 (+) Transcript_6818:200-466(+)